MFPFPPKIVSGTVLALVALLAACRGDGQAPPDAGAPPASLVAAAHGHDLLLITVDTLRADRLGCYGRAAAGTPAIDGLAAAGMRFEDATSGTPITLPSHATILTGLDAPVHGVRHNGTFRLGDAHPTLAEILAGQGYETAAFIGSFVLDARYGLDRGFDHYDDTVEPGEPAPDAAGSYNERPAGAVVDAALAWLEGRDARPDGRPWFAWVHLYDPHAPYAPPPPFDTRFADDPYQGEIAYADAQIGRLLATLERRGVLWRTLVVLTADHGEGLGEHDEPTHADLIYDSTMRVPLIFAHRALFRSPVLVRDRLGGLVDVVPTTLELLGVPYDPDSFSGRALVGSPPDPDRAIYIETLAPLLDYGWAPLHGLRRLRDKLIAAPAPEYYRIRDDRGERNNLYAEAAEARELGRALADRMAAWPSALDVLGQERQLDRDERERLASLGYVRGTERPERIGLRDPKDMMGLWQRMREAGHLSLEGRSREAVARIEDVLREDPTSGKAWYTAARIYGRAGDPARAERSVRRALELSPRVEGWIMLAQLALNGGDRETFERALDEAERLDPLDGRVPIGRGHALAMDGKYREALAEFERAIRIDPARSRPHAEIQIRRLRQRIEAEGGAPESRVR